MKLSLQTDEITLSVDGREMTFSEKELTDILKKHFASDATKQEPKTAKVAQTPTEGEWFEVNPLAIDQKLFQKTRFEPSQEKTRLIILKAFEEVKNNPKKYSRVFETLIPTKTWRIRNVAELKDLAENLGDHNADWVEQALEWAQRIGNGETWSNLCNKADTTNWYRLVVWKNGYARLVGGSLDNYDAVPAVNLHHGSDYRANDLLGSTVPLVVRYK